MITRTLNIHRRTYKSETVILSKASAWASIGREVGRNHRKEGYPDHRPVRIHCLVFMKGPCTNNATGPPEKSA